MAVFHFFCFILVGIVVIGDKLVVVFRLQDGLNVICLSREVDDWLFRESAYSLESLVLISGISHLESGCYDGSEVRSGGNSCILRISALFFQGFCICGRWFHHTAVV